MKQWYKQNRKSKVMRYYGVKDNDGVILLSACGHFYSIKDVVEHVKKIYQHRKKGTVISVCRVDIDFELTSIKEFII